MWFWIFGLFNEWVGFGMIEFQYDPYPTLPVSSNLTYFPPLINLLHHCESATCFSSSDTNGTVTLPYHFVGYSHEGHDECIICGYEQKLVGKFKICSV